MRPWIVPGAIVRLKTGDLVKVYEWRGDLVHCGGEKSKRPHLIIDPDLIDIPVKIPKEKT